MHVHTHTIRGSSLIDEYPLSVACMRYQLILAIIRSQDKVTIMRSYQE